MTSTSGMSAHVGGDKGRLIFMRRRHPASEVQEDRQETAHHQGDGVIDLMTSSPARGGQAVPAVRAELRSRMVAPKNQPAALRAVGPLTRLDLLLFGRSALDYREGTREQIGVVLGEDLATRTIAMMVAYNSLYYSVWLAGGVTAWAELSHTSIATTLATLAWLVVVVLLVRRQVWMHRISRETRAKLSEVYGRPIKCPATPNVPAIRRALRRGGVPESEWPPLPVDKPSP